MSRLFFATVALFATILVVHAQQQPPAQGRGGGGGGRGGGQPVQPIQMVKPGLYVVPGGGVELDRARDQRRRHPRRHEAARRSQLQRADGTDPLGDARSR